MSYGFVYLLGNKAMPNYYKIGCTTGSPCARAGQLSAASGVPKPFHVLLYIEVDNFQRVEQRLHLELSDFRASRRREFFRFGPGHMTWLWYVFETYLERVSFAAPEWHRYAAHPSFPDDYVDTWIDEGDYLHMPSCAPLDEAEAHA